MAECQSNKKPSKSTVQLQGKPGEEDENSSKTMNSGSEKVCQQCNVNDKQLLLVCKICGSNNSCDVCVTQPEWVCPFCCNQIDPKLKASNDDDLQDQFVKASDVFNGFAAGDGTNGWLYESEENPKDTRPVEASDEMNDVGLWKGNDVGRVAKELLQAVENRFPHTFAPQIRSTPYWLSILKGLHLFIKGFVETVVDALTQDQVTVFEAELNDFEMFGFDLSWARKRLDMVKVLKFGNHPLRLEWLEANARLEKARLEYESATNARKNKALEMAEKFGAEYDVLNGTLGFGMLPGNLGYAMDKGTTSRKAHSESLKVTDFNEKVAPKVNEVARKPLKVQRKSFKKSSSQTVARKVNEVASKHLKVQRKSFQKSLSQTQTVARKVNEVASKPLKVQRKSFKKSSSHIQTDQPQVKQKRMSPSVMKNKQAFSSSNLKKFRSLTVRTSPTTLYKALKSLSMVQKRKITDIGFGSLLEFNCSYIPSKLGFFLLDKFDPKSMKLKLKNGDIQITPELIKHIFGIPNGGTPPLSLSSKDSTKDCYVKWHSQFVKEMRPNDLLRKIDESEDDDMVFVLNFIILFLNSIVECTATGACKLDLLERIDEDVDIRSLDWCGYIYDCLKKCNKFGFAFTGPLTVLMLIYLDLTLFKQLETPIDAQPIKFWTGEKLKERQRLEIECGGFGDCEIKRFSEKADVQEQSVPELEVMNTVKEESAEHPS
ncbi:hypothetical protein SSX86_007772 [Deinandra increscens subsp. villosa]|uniref:Uncharacterized protein n=1 Tax=Deinandra increscens subsp. villosa TaxID=3103831 RepID=A0AAP0DLY2_9ASTR